MASDACAPQAASKVCLITSVHPPLDPRILYREGASLARRGLDVTLVAPMTQPETFVHGVRIVRGGRRYRSRVVRMLNSWKPCLVALRQRPDLYHFHDPELVPWAVLLRILTGKPVVWDVHEDYSSDIVMKRWIPRYLRPPISWAFARGQRIAARLLSAIVVADDSVRDLFQNSGVPVVTLYNFPTVPISAEEPGALSYGRRHSVQLVYVGGISAERGKWLMADVVRILVGEYGLDVGLWMAGPFDTEQERQEYDECVRADTLLRDRVILLGVLAPEAVPALLRSADIGLVPLQPCDKFRRNIPTKQFEYMAAGLPVVGSDLPPIRQFVEAAHAGCLATPDDPRDHAKQVASLIQHPELAARMGANGRRAVEERYNWSSEEEKLHALYADLMTRGWRVEGVASGAPRAAGQ